MKKTIKINDKMQKGEYELTQEPGENFDPEFKPELSPKELLEIGIFGGKYMTDCTDEFPSDWFENAKLSPEKKDISLNYYQVDASLPLKTWQEKGWIHSGDPRCWFQWYCRYYYGRRLPEEDQNQIKRWKAIKRHAGAIKKNCEKKDLKRQTIKRSAF